MKNTRLLTVVSLISLILLSLHLADDIARGISRAATENLVAVLILVVWLYGTLMFSERLPGYIIMMLGSLFAAAMPVVHMTGKSYPDIAASSGGLFFIWTLLALGASGTFSFILAARGLWGLRSNRTESQ